MNPSSDEEQRRKIYHNLYLVNELDAGEPWMHIRISKKKKKIIIAFHRYGCKQFTEGYLSNSNPNPKI